MKRFFALTFVLLGTSGVVFAQSNVATQQVSINVAEIAVIAVQGNVSMTINAATAGQAPDAANASATYAVTTNGTQKKITAELDSNMPSGLTLSATMAAPSGASSAGKQALSSNPVDLVTNVTKVRGSGLSLSYEAVATVEADVASTSRTVTYTITNN
jgi:alpha-L-arabinofuranosidase